MCARAPVSHFVCVFVCSQVCFIAYVIGGQASIYGVQELQHKVKDVDVDVNVTTFHLVDEPDTIGSRDPSFNTLMPSSLG